MAITVSWVPRNRDQQGTTLVDHFAATGVAPPEWQAVLEWRYRPTVDDPWGAPTVQTVTPPTLTTSYTPPGDGLVQLTCYAIEGGLASLQGYVTEFPVAGGGLALPGYRILDTGENRITDAGDPRATE